jgi:hypothetical protein
LDTTLNGGRLLLWRWLAAPLADKTPIADRQDAVQVRFGYMLLIWGSCIMEVDRDGRLLRQHR